jgi:hypothetical protein
VEVKFICVESHGEDSYYESEGDYPHELHTINYTTKVVEHVCSYEDAKKFYKGYLERNADNPPYDKYNIKLAFDTETNELMSLMQFEVDDE